MNGAKIRFEPEASWPENEGTADALSLLKPIKDNNGDISYADLIVLAGITALESEHDIELSFCGGYVDADNADGSEVLAPRYYNTPYITVSDDCSVKGLTKEECVALASRERLGTDYYKGLIATGETGSSEYTEYELAFLEGDFGPVVETFSTDEEALYTAFVSGWEKMMTADRYEDNRLNACASVNTPTKNEEPSSAISASAVVMLPALAAVFML